LENVFLGLFTPPLFEKMKPLAPNSLIQNRYLIVHLIGKGGMGEVYLAVDQRLGSAIALKRTFFADDEMLGGAFEREARTLARLRHPVLPKVSDHFTENGEQYLVMEHIAGDDLAKRLEGAQKPFPLSWVLFWADQLLDALAYLHLHEPPIIHRDIKPQNLKLTDENHIVLLDFGLSKNTTGQTKTSGSSGSTGSVVGYTPHYAPMEQIRGTGTDPRSDLYALSATLYQLMSNTVPADALTRADALLNGSADPIEDLNTINPEVSKDVSDVILHGMEVSQEKRFSTAKEMQKALRKAFSQMQEAMSAQTIAFASPNELTSKIEQPVEVIHVVEPELVSESEATRIREPEPVVAAHVLNNEATIRYDGPIDGGLRQADVKTEVYNNATPFFSEPEVSAPTVLDEPPPSSQTDDWSVTRGETNSGYSPDATAANFVPDSAVPGSPFQTENNFSNYSNDQPAYETAPVYAAEPQQFVSTPQRVQPKTQPQRKGSSKALWAVGGLALLVIFGLGAAGAGWFVYSNYYAGAAVEPTPTPQPTLEIAPTPEPTIEVVTSDNTNTSTVELNGNTNTQILTVEPTPAPVPDTVKETNPQPRNPNQTQAETRKTPNKPIQPTGKPTPKKSDRTVILQ